MNSSSLHPLVSIIMPTHNRAAYLDKTIESILSQEYSNFELIIINDASTDDTEAVVKKSMEMDSRITYVRNETNLKIVKTLNKALALARGAYIARADDDDVWCDKEKLKNQIAFLEENTEYNLVGTGAIVVNERGEQLFRYLQPQTDSAIRNSILLGNPFVHPAVVFKKSILAETGFYDEKFTDAEDWEMWLRIGLRGKFYNLPTYSILRFYGSRGVSIKNRVNMARTRMMIIRKYKQNYPHYHKAYLFNLLQKIYSLSPYNRKINDYLFKLKRDLLQS